MKIRSIANSTTSLQQPCKLFTVLSEYLCLKCPPLLLTWFTAFRLGCRRLFNWKLDVPGHQSLLNASVEVSLTQKLTCTLGTTSRSVVELQAQSAEAHYGSYRERSNNSGKPRNWKATSKGRSARYNSGVVFNILMDGSFNHNLYFNQLNYSSHWMGMTLTGWDLIKTLKWTYYALFLDSTRLALHDSQFKISLLCLAFVQPLSSESCSSPFRLPIFLLAAPRKQKMGGASVLMDRVVFMPGTLPFSGLILVLTLAGHH